MSGVSTPPRSALELKDVFRVHSSPEGDAAALQGLSLAVAEGELVAVLGPSGAGKSTLLRILAGVEHPSAGVVSVFGTEIGKLPRRRLADYRATTLGYLDQRYIRSLAPELNARRLVSLQLALRGESERSCRRRADELLERVGLADKRDRRPGQLSGGEQQRVALCASLAHRPRLFLADEPTGELDSANAELIYELIAQLVREHRCTAVMVSHDPESARVADRIVRLRDGRLAEEWSRGGASEASIVIGRGGWLRLPEELLRRAGIGERAEARLLADGILVTPSVAHESPTLPDEQAELAPVPTSGEAVATLLGVEKSYGGTRVLATFDAHFSPGRLHALTGPSGSGKTTLLHILAGLELPDAGSVTVVGVDLTRLDRDGRATQRRSTIAYVGQQAGLVAHLSALENVELALALRGLASPRADAFAALDEVGLAERAHQRVARLSQGERARVALARALAARPALLLADEPTSRLDSTNALAIAVLLARLARSSGTAVVCATHDRLVIDQADEVLALAGRG